MSRDGPNARSAGGDGSEVRMTSRQPTERPGWASVEAVAGSVRGCTLCRLSEHRTNTVPGDGSSNASIMFIGEGPGEQEDRQGLPFVGRAGQLLNELLAGVPLARRDVYITNVVKCRPPGNRDPMPDEVAACWPYLEAQIAMIDPRVIVTLGRHSMARFYPEGRITRDHGRIISLGDRVLFPVFHPAAGLRNPEMKRALFEDFRRLPEAVLHGIALGRSDAPSLPAEAPRISDKKTPSVQAQQDHKQDGGDDEERSQLSMF